VSTYRTGEILNGLISEIVVEKGYTFWDVTPCSQVKFVKDGYKNIDKNFNVLCYRVSENSGILHQILIQCPKSFQTFGTLHTGSRYMQ
jgi:hypothetical protein